MEEILKQILSEIKELKVNQIKTDQKIDNFEAKTDQRLDQITERIDANDRCYREEFRKLDKKMDSISDAVVHTMENITELKDKIEKQDIEMRVIKGGKTQNA